MGNCAGCANPDRKLRQQKSKQLNKSMSPIKTNLVNRDSNLLNSMQYYHQTESKSKSIHDDPWKSRIASKTVKKYIKQLTLREQQFRKDSTSTQNMMNIVSMKEQPVKSIRADSLEQSIAVRNRLSPQQAKERYKTQYNQKFCEEPSEIKQIFFQNGSSINNYNTQSPSPMNQKNYGENSPSNYYDFQGKNTFQRSSSSYMPKKIQRARQKQLQDIMEMFEKDAETPGYVRTLRKQKGEDISMNNFQKFQAIPTFQWFSLSKYLQQFQQQVEQIQEQHLQENKQKQNASKQKMIIKEEKKQEIKMKQIKQEKQVNRVVRDRDSKQLKQGKNIKVNKLDLENNIVKQSKQKQERILNKQNLPTKRLSQQSKSSKVNVKIEDTELDQDLSKLTIKVN